MTRKPTDKPFGNTYLRGNTNETVFEFPHQLKSIAFEEKHIQAVNGWYHFDRF